MSISIYYRELSDSIKSVGLISTLRHVAGTLRDYSYDWRYGTDTVSWEALSDLSIESTNAARGVDYHPTRSRPFIALLGSLELPLEGTFVDFGCGKGRVVLMAMQHGFKRVKGIEFVQDMCKTARENTLLIQQNFGLSADVEIVHGDVMNYEIADDDVIFYFFNPFDEFVMGSVLENIQRSFETVRRKIWLIYYNPIHRDVIYKKAPSLSPVGDYDISGCIFSVFQAE